jgi:hypothetical protein
MRGIISFAVNSFSVYAVVVVPEPTSLGLLTIAATGLLTRRGGMRA